jgi:hypothetical protein
VTSVTSLPCDTGDITTANSESVQVSPDDDVMLTDSKLVCSPQLTDGGFEIEVREKGDTLNDSDTMSLSNTDTPELSDNDSVISSVSLPSMDGSSIQPTSRTVTEVKSTALRKLDVESKSNIKKLKTAQSQATSFTTKLKQKLQQL